ncbi:MAG: DUF5062 family protein [Alteromonadaceae bacterium]|nr:DUF5062 family protein [Alteromonadaceae bacterium]
MKKLKNEAALLKKAVEIGEKYAVNRGYKGFASTNSAKDKVESLYRLLVSDKQIQPLAVDFEDQPNMKHKLALWIAKKLPEGHPLLAD